LRILSKIEAEYQQVKAALQLERHQPF